MLTDRLLTGEEFVEMRFDLPESGQWAELERGHVVQLQPPDLHHGNSLLNLSKAFAAHAQTTQRGYACFDLGLRILRGPDTVRFPAMSYFTAGEPFAESDKQLTDTVPALVVELMSSGDRARVMADRVRDYLAWGVRGVWVVDTRERSIEVAGLGGGSRLVQPTEILSDEGVVPGFAMQAGEIFVEPSWWRG
jgi:Uma2 family endonuclease